LTEWCSDEQVGQSRPSAENGHPVPKVQTWSNLRLDRWARILAPSLPALVVTAWVFRPIFRGRLFGDIMDARWSIAPHEHWFRVWQGVDGIRDLFYYYPQPGTLGTSDAFFLQGQMYSIARALGFDLIDSWLIATGAFFVIGAFGVATLGRRVLQGPFFQVGFVILVCASYPVLTDMLHVQLIGFLVASWIVVGLHDLVTGRRLKTSFALLCLLPPLLAISSWYPVVLLFLVLAVLGCFLLLVSTWPGIKSALSQTGAHVLSAIRSVPGVLSLIGLLICWGLVLWIYVPSLHLLPGSEWWEVMANGPRWSDLVNASDGGGGVWSSLYARIFPPGSANSEQSRGFTPILLGALFVLGLVLFRSAVLGRVRRPTEPGLAGRLGLLAMVLTIVTVAAIFVMDERGISAFRLLWKFVPGMESLRAPFRVQTLQYAMAILVVLRVLELWLRRPWARNIQRVTAAGLSLLLIAAIFIEMQRPPVANWTSDEILIPELRDQIDEAKQQCDAVFVIGPRVETLEAANSVDAVLFATMSGLTTPQGYSRGQPLANPGLVGDGSDFVAFMRGFGFDGRICRVTPTGVELVSGGP